MKNKKKLLEASREEHSAKSEKEDRAENAAHRRSGGHVLALQTNAELGAPIPTEGLSGQVASAKQV